MLLLEKVFGADDASIAPDTKDNYMGLSELTSPERVRDFFELLRQQIIAGEHIERQNNSENSRMAGNQFYKNKYHDRALKCYEEAQKDAPFEWRVYSNKALAFIALGMFEEAVVNAQWASIANPTSGKGISLQASAYARLGYVDVAEYLVTTMVGRFSRDDQNAAKMEVEKIGSKLKQEEKRSMTAMDLHRLCDKMFSSGEQYELPKYAFFLAHLFQAVTTFGIDAILRLEFQDFFSKLFTIQPLRRVFQIDTNPCGFDLLNDTEWSILYEFFMLLQVCRKQLAKSGKSGELESFMKRILSDSKFIHFFQNFAFFLSKRSTLLHFIRKRTFAQCGCTNFFIQLLTFAGSLPELRRTCLNVSPINDPTWYPKILLLTLCTYDPLTGLTDGLLGLMNNFSKEDFFFANLLNMPVQSVDKAFGLLAVESIIYARFRPSAKQANEDTYSHYHHVLKEILPAPSSFVPFWLQATRDSCALPYCVRRLGLWLDVTSRFTLFGCCVLVDLAKRSFENNDELCDSIQLLSNLVSGSVKVEEIQSSRNPNWEEFPMVMEQIVPSMRVLLSCIKKRMRRKTALPDETSEFILKLIALLASRSQKFSTEISSSYSAADPGSLSRLASISIADGSTSKMPPVLRQRALQCFSLLIQDATYESRTKLSKSKHLVGFIKHAINIVGQEDVKNAKYASSSLYHLLNPANSADVDRDECIGIVIREIRQLNDNEMKIFVKKINSLAKHTEVNCPLLTRKNLTEDVIPFAKLLKSICRIDEKIPALISDELVRL